MNKELKISDKAIVKRYKQQERVTTIALSAGCSTTTIYRLIEDLKETRPRIRKGQKSPSNMSFRIKPLPGYKNGMRVAE